jgi:hypothetical protein
VQQAWGRKTAGLIVTCPQRNNAEPPALVSFPGSICAGLPVAFIQSFETAWLAALSRFALILAQFGLAMHMV